MLKKKKQFTASLSFHHKRLAKHLIAWPRGSQNCNLFSAQSTAPTPLLSSQAEPEHFSNTPLAVSLTSNAIFIVLFSLPSLRTFSWLPKYNTTHPTPVTPVRSLTHAAWGWGGYLCHSPCFNTILRLIIPSHFYGLHVSWSCFDTCACMCMHLCTW